jgi:hypothetical protein
MAQDKFDVEVRISRRNSSDPDKDGQFFISVVDTNSRIGFIEIQLKPEDIANMLAGSEATGKATVRSLGKVGKKLVHEHRSMLIPREMVYDKDAAREYLTEKEREECEDGGWSLNLHLGSQSSFQPHSSDMYTAHYSRYKYVDEQNFEEVKNG